MGDAAVDRWKLEGRLYVWRFPERVKGMEGWHLNADAPACKSMTDLLDRMFAAEWKTQKHIPVSVPKRMLVGGGHKWEAVSELLLRYPKGEVEDNFWHTELLEGNILLLTAGAAKLRDLRQSLVGLPAWKDDFAIGPDVQWSCRRGKYEERQRFLAECLWFWTKVE